MSFPFARALPAILVLATIVAGLWGYQNFIARARTDRPAPAPAAVYSTRGRIEQLPGSSRAAMFQIHHERIPEFRDQSGKIVGMNEMVMPFATAEGVSTEGLAVGDEIAFTFEHRWGEQPRITSLKRLENRP